MRNFPCNLPSASASAVEKVAWFEKNACLSVQGWPYALKLNWMTKFITSASNPSTRLVSRHMWRLCGDVFSGE